MFVGTLRVSHDFISKPSQATTSEMSGKWQRHRGTEPGVLVASGCISKAQDSFLDVDFSPSSPTASCQRSRREGREPGTSAGSRLRKCGLRGSRYTSARSPQHLFLVSVHFHETHCRDQIVSLASAPRAGSSGIQRCFLLWFRRQLVSSGEQQSQTRSERFVQIKPCLQVCECVQVGAEVIGRLGGLLQGGAFSNTDNISSVLPLSLLIPQ